MKNLNSIALTQIVALAQAGCKVSFDNYSRMHVEIIVDVNDKKKTRYIETVMCYDADIEHALETITNKIIKPSETVKA